MNTMVKSSKNSKKLWRKYFILIPNLLYAILKIEWFYSIAMLIFFSRVFDIKPNTVNYKTCVMQVRENFSNLNDLIIKNIICILCRKS